MSVAASKHYKHKEDGCTAPGVCSDGSVPLSNSGNVVTKIGIHTHTFNLLPASGEEQMNASRLAKRREILIFTRTVGNTGNSREILVILGNRFLTN